MNYIFQKMTAKDISAVALLLQANSESQQGGLHGEYPLNKVEAMYQNSTNAIVALYQENIIAVVFSFPVTSFSIPPIAQAIHQRFPEITQNNWLYGPVCIDKSHRGKSLLKDLYQKICSLHGRHPIAFINCKNIRSLKAHQKLGMEVVKNFEFDGTSWWIVKGQ